MSEIGAALGRLQPEARALLDLSLRRGMSDEEIAGVLRVEAAELSRRRAEALDRLTTDLGLDGREQRAELLATLPDLPAELWKGE
jgi:DNA-directed RNA polymerase specialized sigma24 family protein